VKFLEYGDYQFVYEDGNILGASVRSPNTRVVNTWTAMGIEDYFEEQHFISLFIYKAL